MKKILITIAIAVALLCVLVLAGCEHEHEWSEWKTAKEPTCTETGVEERACKCGEKETKEITKLEHVRGDWVIDTEPTCTSDGAKHLSCTVCSEVMVSGSIPSLGHTDGEWITDAEATCTTDGSKHQICSVCNETIKTETIAAIGHNYIFDSLENNGAIGSNVVYKCSNCNEIKKEIINELSVTVTHTGSSEASLSGWGSFSQYFNAEATGGYGEYQYKFEMYYDSSSSIPVEKLTKDFSSDNTYGVSYRGYRNELNGYVLKVTVTDAAGNTATGIYVFNF